MFEITYWEMLAAISVMWIIVRLITGLKDKKYSVGREVLLLMVYVCIIVIARIVYFPWHHVNGQIGTLIIDAKNPRINLVPVVNLIKERYEGWQRNLFGNIAMFIPVGIVWPACFKKIRSFGKTLLAGFGFTLIIEISQLVCYDRSTDIDDLMLNTAGVAVGALIFFVCRRMFAGSKKRQ